MFNDSLKEMKISSEQNTKDIEFLKTKISELATKDEIDGVLKKFQRYIDALNEINNRSSLSKDISQLKTLLESLK